MPTKRALEARAKIEAENPTMRGRIGIETDVLYIHNPKTGFHEVLDEETLQLTGQCPY